MNKKEVMQLILDDMINVNITKAMNKLGLERTYEAIESISNCRLRARLRLNYLNRFKKED